MELLAGPEIHAKVIQLVEGAQRELVLISPYFKPWKALSTALKTSIVVRKVAVYLVLRGGEDRSRQEEAARPLKEAGAKVFFVERLHAKLYLSETEGLLTSMNLLDSSALDSWEIAVRVTLQREREDFVKFQGEAAKILKKASDEAQVGLHTTSQPIVKPPQKDTRAQGVVQKPVTVQAPVTAPKPRASAIEKGHCLRCCKPITLDLNKPLCRTCYERWAEYSNPEYIEAFCLMCGTEHDTSMARPLCRSCFRKMR